MTTEKQLMTKSYYQSIVKESEREHPIKVLGQMYREEMEKDQPDLATIRFAQGEVYFLNHDYEAAIYKWKQAFDHDLIPWGEKNIADAYLEMGLLDEAEALYRQVETDSVGLKIDVLLQLFLLSNQQGKKAEAARVIKEAVALDPDDANVTEVAKHYFEDIEDWDSAIELALDEAIRTGDVEWFEVIEGYLDRQLLNNYDPSDFKEMFVRLYRSDKRQFEHLVERFWHSYDNDERYIDWLEEINNVLAVVDLDRSLQWNRLPELFEEGYVYLISGKFLIRELSDLIGRHLTNWLSLSIGSDPLVSSSAIIVWDEEFPKELPVSLVNEARFAFEKVERRENGQKDGLKLYESIKAWTAREEMLDGIAEFIEKRLGESQVEQVSPAELRDLIRAIIRHISTEQKEAEEAVKEAIVWNEALRADLREFDREINEDEQEKVSSLTHSFRQVRNELKDKVKHDLPELFRSCADSIDSDTDFSNLYANLNERMNREIYEYIEGEFLPEYQSAFSEWLLVSEEALGESRVLLAEFGEKINEQFGEERLDLSGDLLVLGDWGRDIERTSRVLLQKREVNIFLRNNPSQLLLKGVGKLFGSLSGNKELIAGKHKDSIKNGHYREAVMEVTGTFFQQLSALEESIEWDLKAFYARPKEVLGELTEDVEFSIEKAQGLEREMREYPERREDPLKLFDLKLRHYELVYPLDRVDVNGK